MEINIGEFIRTKNKGICKIHHINEKATVNKYWVNPDYDDWCTVVKTNEIVKHSPNIIDLIEVGDYVNGIYVDEFDDVEGNLYLGFAIYDDALMDCVTEFRPLETVEIKTIVTKEQFKNVMYEV